MALRDYLTREAPRLQVMGAHVGLERLDQTDEALGDAQALGCPLFLVRGWARTSAAATTWARRSDAARGAGGHGRGPRSAAAIDGHEFEFAGPPGDRLWGLLAGGRSPSSSRWTSSWAKSPASTRSRCSTGWRGGWCRSP